MTTQPTWEIRFEEEFKDVVNSGYWWRLFEQIKSFIRSVIEEARRGERGKVKKEIEKMIAEIHEVDSEKWGWDNLEEMVGHCCSGDDIANGAEFALKKVLASLKEPLEDKK